MRALTYAKRTAREILRDPLNIAFGLGFPVILLLLLSAIQKNVPVQLFEIESLAPGIAVFGLSFITLFTATLIAKDRESALLERLCTTPMKSVDFIIGYTLSVIPIALTEGAVCYIVALVLGLTPNVNVIYAALMIAPISLFYISLGLLFGSILNVKQVGGVCGALLTNLSAWLSGVWFDTELLGENFQKITRLLPFLHAVELERALISGNFAAFPSHLYPVLIYTLIFAIGATVLFLRGIRKK